MEASGAADDEPGLAGDDKLRRGVRALEDVGPRPGETLKEWAAQAYTDPSGAHVELPALAVELATLLPLLVVQ